MPKIFAPGGAFLKISIIFLIRARAEKRRFLNSFSREFAVIFYVDLTCTCYDTTKGEKF